MKEDFLYIYKRRMKVRLVTKKLRNSFSVIHPVVLLGILALGFF